MRTRPIISCLVLLGALLSACSAGATRSDDHTLVWALSSAPRSFDPAHGFDGATMLVVNEALEPLISLDSEGKVVPRLAESWTHPDPLTYVYTLRPGVRFWDGSELTADDVAFSINRNLDPATASELGSYLQDVASVTAPDPHTVTITLKKPVPTFEYVVGLVSHTVSKDYATKHAAELGDSNTLTMGTGPYRVTAFSAEGVTMEANEEYWGRRPTMNRLEFKVIADQETLRLALESGEVDGTFSAPPTRSGSWKSVKGATVQYVDAPVVSMLSMDVTSAPWDDIHVRRAVAHAIDRTSMVDAVFHGGARVADSIVDPELWGNIASKEEVANLYDGLTVYDHDLEKARAELAQSQSPGGFSFTVTYPAQSATAGKALQVIAADLEPLGIRLTPKEVPVDKWLAVIYAHEDLGAQFFRFGADYPDPETVQRSMLGEANAIANGFNIANFTTPELEQQLARSASPDGKARTEALAEVMRITNEQVPYLPLYYEDNTLALSDGLTYRGSYSFWVPFFQEWASNLEPAT